MGNFVIERLERLYFMQHGIPSATAEPGRIPEARYSYYRRCRVFRHNGQQCKAPAEKGSQICYAHAGQQAMAFRRDLERRVVLAEAVAEMRRQGHTECALENLLTDFKGIQVTLAVMARAIIADRIDCKTAGRLVVHLQMMSKLLWTLHKNKTLPLINADSADCKELPEALEANAANLATNEREKTRIVLISPRFKAGKAELARSGCVEIRLGEQVHKDCDQAHGPPKLRAA